MAFKFKKNFQKFSMINVIFKVYLGFLVSAQNINTILFHLFFECKKKNNEVKKTQSKCLFESRKKSINIQSVESSFDSSVSFTCFYHSFRLWMCVCFGRRAVAYCWCLSSKLSRYCFSSVFLFVCCFYLDFYPLFGAIC